MKLNGEFYQPSLLARPLQAKFSPSTNLTIAGRYALVTLQTFVGQAKIIDRIVGAKNPATKDPIPTSLGDNAKLNEILTSD
jgi:hypothetical protein